MGLTVEDWHIGAGPRTRGRTIVEGDTDCRGVHDVMMMTRAAFS
jgi:hypothetical protein